jgi:hypothetical protein
VENSVNVILKKAGGGGGDNYCIMLEKKGGIIYMRGGLRREMWMRRSEEWETCFREGMKMNGNDRE